jgi:hypothetical protein
MYLSSSWMMEMEFLPFLRMQKMTRSDGLQELHCFNIRRDKHMLSIVNGLSCCGIRKRIRPASAMGPLLEETNGNAVH